MSDDIRIRNIIKNDGWMNLFSGLGTKADKRKSTKDFTLWQLSE